MALTPCVCQCLQCSSLMFVLFDLQSGDVFVLLPPWSAADTTLLLCRLPLTRAYDGIDIVWFSRSCVTTCNGLAWWWLSYVWPTYFWAKTRCDMLVPNNRFVFTRPHRGAALRSVGYGDLQSMAVDTMHARNGRIPGAQIRMDSRKVMLILSPRVSDDINWLMRGALVIDLAIRCDAQAGWFPSIYLRFWWSIVPFDSFGRSDWCTNW